MAFAAAAAAAATTTTKRATSSSPAAPPSASPSPSPSPPLFMCCVSLPGPLQPLSLPSSPSGPDLSSSSPSSSSSSSAEPRPPRHSLPTLSEIAHLEHRKPGLTIPHPHLQRNQVAELLLFRRSRKLGLRPQQQQQQSNQASSNHREHSRHHRHRHGHELVNPNPSEKHRSSNKSDDVRKSWELLKSGEVSNLIKQGFIERTQRRLSPGRVSPLLQETIASSAGKAMSPLHTSLRKPTPGHDARLLCASSPPPDRLAKPNTLFDMMSRDAELRSKPKTIVVPTSSLLILERSSSSRHAGSSRNPLFNNADCSDVKLTLKGRDGREVCLNLHRRILVEHSKFFATRLSEAWCKQQQQDSPYMLEIEDCEDLEMYQETLHLLYCRDLPSRIIKYSVSRVLGILKVAALILFEACIVSCLEYLEAAPWAEEEEDKVRALLGQLQLGSFTAADVLKRLNTEDGSGSEETLVRLLETVIKGKDNKARREMKTLVSKMLRENMSQNRVCIDLSKESLYHACTTCLDALLILFLQASKIDFMNEGNEDRGTLVAQIAHQADNLQWLLEILLDRHIAKEFVKMWACQSDLASVHKQIATVLRFEVSRLTARLCVAIGKGQVLCPVEVRYMLLQTWLPPLIDDFGWMQRCCKGLDKNVVEDGISQTILTLPLKQQQSILLAWFDRFSNNGDDCPNLQRAFEVWWRRTFVRPCVED